MKSSLKFIAFVGIILLFCSPLADALTFPPGNCKATWGDYMCQKGDYLDIYLPPERVIPQANTYSESDHTFTCQAKIGPPETPVYELPLTKNDGNGYGKLHTFYCNSGNDYGRWTGAIVDKHYCRYTCD